MRPRHVALLCALAALWGGSYLLIKYGLEDFSPSMVVFLRTAVGAAVLLAAIRLQGGDAWTALPRALRRPALALLLGALAIVGAAACYALSTFVVKGPYRAVPSITTSFTSVATGAVLTIPFAVATAPDHVPGAGAIAAVVGLGVGATALGFLIFYVLIREIGAARASSVSYLAPVFALVYGALFYGEEITVAAVVGFMLIVVGFVIASRQARPAEPALEPAAAGPPVEAPAGR